MNLFEWSQDYAVGIRLIDNDHRGLFETINALHEAVQQESGEAEIGNTLNALIRYVQEHFTRENAGAIIHH